MDKNLVNRRIIYIYIVFVVLFVSIIGGLYYWQVFRSEEIAVEASNQHVRRIVRPAQRGNVLDSNEEILVYNITEYECWINTEEFFGNPVVQEGNSSQTLQDSTDEITAGDILAEILEISPDELLERINSNNEEQFIIGDGLSIDKANLITGNDLDGIWMVEKYKRVYPFENMASLLIGHTSDDIRGIAGIEYIYEDYLSGEDGLYTIVTDGSGRQLPFTEEDKIEPIDGYDVHLTIDSTIQYFTEMRVKEAYEEWGAKSVSAVIMDPNTGDIISMAEYPNYNPNEPREPFEADREEFELLTDDQQFEYWNKMWSNSQISSVYEPGSTFKSIIAAASLEEEITYKSREFYCPGYIDITGIRLRCWIYSETYSYGIHGKQTFMEAFSNSCNPTFAAVAIEMGTDTLYDYIDKFGFTSKTGIDLPGEATSLMISKDSSVPVDLAVLGYGHAISVTPIQMVTAISSLVNGGYLMEPRIVSSVIDENGSEILYNEPIVKEQVISKQTSDTMREMFEFTVDSHDNLFNVNGVKTGGKTGTTVKFVDGEYDNDKVYASFVGILPIDNPQYVILVIADEPGDEGAGTTTAGPVATKIMEDVVSYVDFSSTGEQIYDGSNANTENEMQIVANYVGLELEAAVNEIETDGFIYTTNSVLVEELGQIVIDQYPRPGGELPLGGMIILQIEE